MKELEIDLPKSDDSSVVARVKRLHFYSVREDFITVWKNHEQFLVDYEERVKRTIQRHAKIGNFTAHPINANELPTNKKQAANQTSFMICLLIYVICS